MGDAEETNEQERDRPRSVGNVLAIIALAFLVLPAAPFGGIVPTVSGEAQACEDVVGMDDPLAGISLIFAVGAAATIWTASLCSLDRWLYRLRPVGLLRLGRV